MTARDWGWILFLGVLWGTSFMLIAIALRGFDPLWVAGGRLTVGAIACFALLAVLRTPMPRDPALYAALGLYGVVAYALPFMFFPIAQQNISSGVAAIINAMTPLTTVIVSQFWPGGEKATPLKAAGVLCGLAGAAVLAWPSVQSGGSSEVWAILLCFAATLCYALTLNFARRFRHLDPKVIAALGLLGGAVASSALAFSISGVPSTTDAMAWLAIIVAGVFVTALPFLIMFRILPRVGATNFSITTLISPVVAVALGITVLGEPFRLEHAAGMLGIFIGLMLMDGRIVRGLSGRRPAADKA